MFFMIRMSCCGFSSGMNPNDDREDRGRLKAAFDRARPGVTFVCFPIFELCFHVQRAT